MEKVTGRLLPFALGDGPHNMAADEVLLQAAISGTCSLRFYGWQEPTLSLGYFQKAACRMQEPRLASLPFVRRPTGGATLVHHHELTYALALPAAVLRKQSEPWLERMHRIIAAALNRLGAPCDLVSSANDRGQPAGILCFKQLVCGDILCGHSKVVGSAQRKQRLCLLQHGAILLKTSPHAPQLPGIWEKTGRELTCEETQNATCQEFVRQTGWELAPGAWTPAEAAAIAELAARKYCEESWNKKR